MQCTNVDLRSSIAPGLSGQWACDLTTERLQWSDEVFDLFGLPHGIVPDRATAIARYAPASLVAMECLRAAAIRDRSGFSLDAQIRTPHGLTRWIRIVERVDHGSDDRPTLSGTKTDVTDDYQPNGP